jgi:hypothetical protein
LHISTSQRAKRWEFSAFDYANGSQMTVSLD